MDHIVHLGKGRTALAPQRPFVDPTVARPVKNAKVAARLAALAQRLHYRREPQPVRFLPTSLLNLQAEQCRYPIADDLFCGGQSAHGKSWCAAHDDIVHGREKRG